MTGSFILDYYLLVFLASLGLFQMAAAHRGLVGMSFFRRRPLSFLAGLVLLAGALAWFFLSEPRNVSDSGHGLNGNEQFAYFFAGSGSSLAFTLAGASLRHWALGASRQAPAPGLDALREATYFHAMRLTWVRLRSGLDPKDQRPQDQPPGETGPPPARPGRGTGDFPN